MGLPHLTKHSPLLSLRIGGIGLHPNQEYQIIQSARENYLRGCSVGLLVFDVSVYNHGRPQLLSSM